jgi:hypothetical protein
MDNFLKNKPDAPEFGDGRDITLTELKKVFARGPQRPASLTKRAPNAVDTDAEVRAMAMSSRDVALRSNADEATKIMKSAHARGPDPFLPHTVGDGPLFIERSRDPVVQAIRKAHERPRGFGPAGERQVDVRALNAMLERGRRMRKLRKGLPPQSANGDNDSRTANTGASNDWRDESAPANTSSQLGTRHAASINNGRAPATQDDVTVKALKEIVKHGPQRF